MGKSRKQTLYVLENVRQLIAKDKIEEALRHLNTVSLKAEDSNFILQQSARLKEAEKHYRNNVSSLEDLSRIKANVRFAILTFLNDYEKGVLKTPEPQIEKNRKGLLFTGVLSMVILFFLFIYSERAYFQDNQSSTVVDYLNL